MRTYMTLQAKEDEECNALRNEVARLTAWIIEADSAFNLDCAQSTSLDECAGLVRMCREGRAAIDQVARLKAVPQKINDAIWQYCERDDDGMIDIDNVTAIIAKIAGDGSLGDDSLWFTGEQWSTVVGDLDEARAEIARLRAALRTITDRYEFICTNCDDGWAGHDDWSAIADAKELIDESYPDNDE